MPVASARGISTNLSHHPAESLVCQHASTIALKNEGLPIGVIGIGQAGEFARAVGRRVLCLADQHLINSCFLRLQLVAWGIIATARLPTSLPSRARDWFGLMRDGRESFKNCVNVRHRGHGKNSLLFKRLRGAGFRSRSPKSYVDSIEASQYRI